MEFKDTIGKEELISQLDTQATCTSYLGTKRKLNSITKDKDKIIPTLAKSHGRETRCSDAEKLIFNTIHECITKHTDKSTSS